MIIEEIKNKASTQLSDWKITAQLDIMKIPGLKKFWLIDLLKRGRIDTQPLWGWVEFLPVFFFMVKKKRERANVVYSLCCRFFRTILHDSRIFRRLTEANKKKLILRNKNFSFGFFPYNLKGLFFLYFISHFHFEFILLKLVDLKNFYYLNCKYVGSWIKK